MGKYIRKAMQKACYEGTVVRPSRRADKKARVGVKSKQLGQGIWTRGRAEGWNREAGQ